MLKFLNAFTLLIGLLTVIEAQDYTFDGDAI